MEVYGKRSLRIKRNIQYVNIDVQWLAAWVCWWKNNFEKKLYYADRNKKASPFCGDAFLDYS